MISKIEIICVIGMVQVCGKCLYCKIPMLLNNKRQARLPCLLALLASVLTYSPPVNAGQASQ